MHCRVALRAKNANRFCGEVRHVKARYLTVSAKTASGELNPVLLPAMVRLGAAFPTAAGG